MASVLLGRCGADMVGKRLLNEFPGPGGRQVFDTYSLVAIRGAADSARCPTEPSSPSVLHHAHFAGQGVFVVLSDPKAIARKRLAKTAIHRLDPFRSGLGEPTREAQAAQPNGM
jgi:hypothetical protein